MIFNDISFEIIEGERIGIVGRNGTGKTTIFKLISSLDVPDSGAIYTKKGLTIGHLEQISSYDDDFIVQDVLRLAFQEIFESEKKLKQMEKAMSEEKDSEQLTKILKEYGEIEEEFARRGGYEIEAEISKVVNGLQINDLLLKEFHKLSGGEQTKVNLGRILLSNPELMLLDEPTNHLDIQALEWFEEYLKQYKGTVIIISHDRYFLDHVITKIIDLDNGEINMYQGNYSFFIKEKEQRLLAEFMAYQDQQKKIKKMKEAIKRLREWANKANPPNEGLHRRASSMEKALEKMEMINKPNIDAKKINLNFDFNQRSGNDVFSFKEVSKSFHHKRPLNRIDLSLKYKEQVALIGKNGTGKTTLFKLLLGELIPDSGEVRIGSNVKIGYLSQHVMGEYLDFTVLDAFRDEVPVLESEARNILAKFMFYGNTVFKKVKNLSGGEKTRLKLAQLMYQEFNVLLLDEPTNHLDIDSREMLEEALQQYEGTIFCVSHDRYFLNKLFQITYWIENGEIFKYEGNYSYAKTKRDELKSNNTIENQPSEQKIIIDYNETKKVSPGKNILQMEDEIKQIELTISELEEDMFKEHDVGKLQELHSKKEEIEKKRDQLYQELNLLVEEQDNEFSQI